MRIPLAVCVPVLFSLILGCGDGRHETASEVDIGLKLRVMG